jgi:hypothetical protein
VAVGLAAGSAAVELVILPDAPHSDVAVLRLAEPVAAGAVVNLHAGRHRAQVMSS